VNNSLWDFFFLNQNYKYFLLPIQSQLRAQSMYMCKVQWVHGGKKGRDTHKDMRAKVSKKVKKLKGFLLSHIQPTRG